MTTQGSNCALFSPLTSVSVKTVLCLRLLCAYQSYSEDVMKATGKELNEGYWQRTQ